MAQQAFVLLDANKPDLAVAATSEADAHSSPVPPAHAGVACGGCGRGNGRGGARGRSEVTNRPGQDLLLYEDCDELPYLVLTQEHLAGLRGHCLARLGDPETVVSLLQSAGG
jgi:hypothetical protein